MSGSTYSYTGKIVTYTVPATDTYDITAYGAQGGGVGGGAGGLGAEIGGDFMLTAGQKLTIAVGGQGNHIDAGGGSNAITGGTGDDTFVLPAASQGFDTISGFTETIGDVLDLRAALAATSWNKSAATLGNYLKVTDGGGNTTLSIAASGSGAGTAIATLEGVSYGLADLLSHHSLLTS